MIFRFENYRDYLKDYLAVLPKAGHGEARKIAQHLGVSSTYVSHVMSGDKTLTPEQGQQLSGYLGLSEMETEYFYYLVQLERAGTEPLKNFCKKKLATLSSSSMELSKRVRFERAMTEEETSIFYSNPMYSVIHLFSSIHKSGVSIEETAIRFRLSRINAAKYLRFLAETGLCAEAEGRFTFQTQGTHLSSDSPHLLKHHENWRLRAIRAAEDLSPDELMYTVNVSLSETDFRVLREEMVLFIKKFLETVYPSPAESLATFNMDFFRVRD